jgi:hypothetical protein
METTFKSASAELILKLYELRRDEELRQAREWFVTKFRPQSADDIVKLLTSSFEGSRYYRMVTTYWEMAATLVNHNGMDKDMFLDANTEHIVVFSVVEPFLAEVRTKFRANYLVQLETVVRSIPDIDKLLEGRRRLLKGWKPQRNKIA